MAKFIEDDNFFDAHEEISSESDSASSKGSEGCISEPQRVAGNVANSFHYDFWTGNPKSVDERRDEFIRQTGFVLERCHTAREGPDDAISEDIEMGGSNNEEKDLGAQTIEAVSEEEDMLWRIKCLDDGREFDVDDVDHNGMPRTLHEVGIDRWVTVEEFQRTFQSSNLVHHIMRREPKEGGDMVDLRKQPCEGSWLRRFSNKAITMFRKHRVDKKTVFGSNSQRVRVRSHKKWSKELSSLYRKQDFCAHKGSILAMKFSVDGQHLATGAEDGSLLVWKVIEDDRSNDLDILSFSPTSACLFFSVNGISNLASFLKIKEEGNVFNKLKKRSESACIMVPQKVFRILEKPLQELHGHEGEILDISWSKRGQLLSSSVDKTTRLWQVGSDQCLRVFPHNDYVTCAQFNPVDDNFFISGSIDGIVRIWEVLGCQVVDWIDIKEIVTAICYHPDGKGGIVGSMIGNCCFFEITGNVLQPGSVIHLQGKKNLTCKRITGFQFSPNDTSEVVVSSADSQVRILRGTDIVCRFRGSIPLVDHGHGGSQIFASFTADGRHIISAIDDSNVYIWNHINNGRISNCKTRNIWSCESFSSHKALIAVPWHGIKSMSELPSSPCRQDNQSRASHNQLDVKLQQCPSGDVHSPSSHVCSPPSSGHTTRPEQDHRRASPPTVVVPAIEGIDYELLTSACESILSGSHMWGVVIVTGGTDGRIRTYQNYGIPVGYPRRGKSLRSSFSFSTLRKRCTDKCSKLRSSSFHNVF